MGPGYCSHFNDAATGWTIRGSNPGRGERFFSSPKYWCRLWGQLNFLFCWYWPTFPRVERPGREIYHFRALERRLRLRAASAVLHAYVLVAWTGTVLPFVPETFIGKTLKGAHCYHLPVPLSWNLGILTSWNRLGHFRPVTGLLYLTWEVFAFSIVNVHLGPKYNLQYYGTLFLILPSTLPFVCSFVISVATEFVQKLKTRQTATVTVNCSMAFR